MGTVIEGQLAWLVYLMGTLVGGRSTTNCSDEYDEIDAELSARAFRLMHLHDQRLQVRVPFLFCFLFSFSYYL